MVDRKVQQWGGRGLESRKPLYRWRCLQIGGGSRLLRNMNPLTSDRRLPENRPAINGGKGQVKETSELQVLRRGTE